MPSTAVHRPYFDDLLWAVFGYRQPDTVLCHHPIQQLRKKDTRERERTEMSANRMNLINKWCPVMHLHQIPNKRYNAIRRTIWCTYCCIRLSMTTLQLLITSNEKKDLLFCSINLDGIVLLAATTSSISHTSVYNKCCSLSQWLSELWLSDIK